MSLRVDAISRELGLADGALLHISGPRIPISAEGIGHLEALMGLCCYSKIEYGPERCTCWEPVFDMEQAEPVTERVGMVAGEIPARGGQSAHPRLCDLHETPTRSVTVRSKCCHDCAYRAGSPERDGGFTEEALLALPAQAHRVFACHQGMVRVIRWTHPCGVEVPAGEGDYRPPVIDGVAFKADGTPAELCAGWAALR